MSTDTLNVTDDALTAALAQIPAYVDAGEDWLPTLDPDWFNTVDPATLLMASNTRCVIGQIAVAKGFPGAHDLLRETGLWADTGDPGQIAVAVKHGFTAPWSVTNRGAYFEALRREWVRRIERRRAALDSAEGNA